jgi:GTPase SAR1 family protein
MDKLDLIESHDFSWKHPVRIAIVGPSNVGKSTLCLNIIKNRHFILNQHVDVVVYLYVHWDPAFNNVLKTDPKVIFTNKIEFVDDLLTGDFKSILFLDDQFVNFTMPAGAKFITGMLRNFETCF